MLKEGLSRFLKLDSLMESLTGFVEARLELVKYELKEDASKILSKAAVYGMVLMVATFVLLFISLAVALQLSVSLGYFGGFAVVASVYLLGGAVLYLSREKLINGLERRIRKAMVQKKK